jgi:tetratricopeptide (TPR) repeat protein
MKRKNTRYLLAAVVSLVTAVVYLPALRNDFVIWDDDLFIVDNPFIRSLSREFFMWAFTDASTDFWRPVIWISHALDYAVWGLNPAGHHLTSLLLHSLNTFLVVCLVIKLLETFNENRAQVERFPALSSRSILITGAATGALFGLHPVHVESVAWVTTRTDLLYSLFFLLSIMFYADYAASLRNRPADKPAGIILFDRNYAIALGLFALSLMSKPMAVTLPLILLLLDWYPLRRPHRLRDAFPLLVEKIPFLAASAAVSGVTLLLTPRVTSNMTTLAEVPFLARMLVAAKALVLYLWNMFLPVHLSPFYPYPDTVSFTSPEYFGATALVCGITAGCLLAVRKHPLWLFLWGYYVISLVPVLGLVRGRYAFMADRYTYLSSIGPFLLAGLGAAWLWEKADSLRTCSREAMYGMAAAGIMLAVPLSVQTVNQIAVWKDSVSLWSFVIAEEPVRVPIAYNNRGVERRKKGQLDLALQDYTRAIELDPKNAKFYTNRGIAFGETGQMRLALEDIDRALSLDPDYADAYTSRGLVFAETGQFDQAIQDYTRALVLNAVSVDAYYNRGIAYERMDRPGLALEDFTRAITVDPSDHQLYIERARVHGRLGHDEKALEDYSQAIAIRPDFAAAYLYRGDWYLRRGRSELAKLDYELACRLGSEEGCNTLNTFGGR